MTPEGPYTVGPLQGDQFQIYWYKIANFLNEVAKEIHVGRGAQEAQVPSTLLTAVHTNQGTLTCVSARGRVTLNPPPGR